MEGNWIQMGMVGVDSGTIATTDPGYMIPDDKWDQFCDKELSKLERGGGTAMVKAPGSRRTLVAVVNSGVGDGMYPVEVRMVDGMIAEVRVRFLEDDGRQPGMLTERQAAVMGGRDRARMQAADKANVKKYGKRT